ncbi:MAG: hypothetical protein GY782_02135 [Gammaproteobacteria bacterium]|nr:hypothetical protein [Gammaproteobacteria bacterium]
MTTIILNRCCKFFGTDYNYQRSCVHQRVSHLCPTIKFPALIHSSAVIAANVTIGQGTIILPGAVVGNFSTIGQFCFLNTLSSVSHDNLLVSDYCSMGPNASTGGSVRINRLSAICQAATVIHHINIGENCLVGAGALLLTHQSDHTVMVGSPARLLKKRPPGDRYL